MSNEKVKSYRDLLVWQRGLDLVKSVYVLSQRFPADERFGLTMQLRRAAVSVPSNIAEGQARHTTGEFVQSISHSEGSLAELDTQLVIATRLGYCKQADIEAALSLVTELQKMLGSLRRKLQEKPR